MATSTTRLALRKPDPDPVTGDNVNVVTDINQSMDKIDGNIGFTVCTSGTRPGSPWDGQPIYETDTNKFRAWVESAWTDIPSPTQAASLQLSFLQAAYPVGAIYLSGVSTSPATLFGFGTWTAITDRFLVGVGSTFTTPLGTGGANTVTIATANLPAHNHGVTDPGHVHAQQVSANNGVGSANGRSDYGADAVNMGVYPQGVNTVSATTGVTTTNTGSGTALNVNPPYLAVYMWRRTA